MHIVVNESNEKMRDLLKNGEGRESFNIRHTEMKKVKKVTGGDKTMI